MILEEENNKFHILTHGIILDKDNLLIFHAKNANNTFLPGGHLEFKEDLKTALKREILEEIGIKCTIGNYIGCVESTWMDKNIYNQEVNHLFLVNGITKDMDIKSKENHIVLYWIKINEFEKENLLPFPMREIIKEIYNGNMETKYISKL